MKLKKRKNIILIISASMLIIFFVILPPFFSINPSVGKNHAIIIDPLYLDYPNQDFIDKAKIYLTEAGFKVDVYKGSNITVQFLKNLPKGYRVVIIRSHSGLWEEDGEVLQAITTAEYYDESLITFPAGKYWSEASDNQLAKMTPWANPEKAYFCVLPRFVEMSMKGKFQNSIVIAMGCTGLVGQTNLMAKAFVGQGALVYVGWNDYVRLNDTDAATLELLKAFLLRGLPLNSPWIRL